MNGYKTAERLKDVVETLLYNERNGISVPGKTTDMWLHSAHPHLQSKLAKAGLITIEAKKTCQEVWNQFLKYRTDLKASTIKLYHWFGVHLGTPAFLQAEAMAFT